MPNDAPQLRPALLVLPRLRIQNANAISSPLTWGFPAITAFTSLSVALERRLGREAGVQLGGIGVICHGHEAQVTHAGWVRNFRLTRNPVDKDGSTAAIVEEGRIHLDLTLVLQAWVDPQHADDQLDALAAHIADTLAGMRVAGGSVLPTLPATGARRPPRPRLWLLPGDADERQRGFRRLARQWLPGFALVSRDDLLADRLAELRAADPAATALDAWLDLARLNHRCQRSETPAKDGGAPVEHIEWLTDPRKGWLVPMPVGYAALGPLHDAGSVAGARDPRVPFRFVESVYSIGQWISPHRLANPDHLFWSAEPDDGSGLYRCVNRYTPPPTYAD